MIGLSSRLTWTAIYQGIQLLLTGFMFHALTVSGIYAWLFLFVKLLLSKYWWIAVLYYMWILVDNAPWSGYRMCRFIKSLKLFFLMRDYFSAKLIKTVDLDPSKNYIFAGFPHGTFTIGSFLSFINDTLDFSKLFPGLTSRFMMHHYFFYIPFYREIMLSFSACACTEKSLKYLLDEKKFKGNCTVISVGGAREGIESEPGKPRLILNKRKGFIRIAIQTGTSIVPVYTFGETELFKKTKYEENSFLYRLQMWLLNTTGLMLLRLSGKGFGWLPFKQPLNVVVGAPLEVKKNPNPTAEEIDLVHAEFKKRLIHLFETNKAKYIVDPENTFLEFVG